MAEIIDLLLRSAGIVLATVLALSPIGLFVGICVIPLTAPDWPIWKRVLLGPVYSALAAVALYVTWRMIRFAAGYTASSEYPLHFVVRWLF